MYPVLLSKVVTVFLLQNPCVGFVINISKEIMAVTELPDRSFGTKLPLDVELML